MQKILNEISLVVKKATRPSMKEVLDVVKVSLIGVCIVGGIGMVIRGILRLIF